jgi:hypothetical protein
MSTILEVLFDDANRRLRRLGLLGALIGLPLIVYVEIPAETAAIQTELHNIGRSVTHNLLENQQRIRAREHQGPDAVKRRQRDRLRHSVTRGFDVRGVPASVAIAPVRLSKTTRIL